MTTHVVRIGECRVTANPQESLITYALGSCIALAIYDPISRVAGLLHLLLPAASLDPSRAASQPSLFADTGIPAFFHQLYRHGARKSRLRVLAAGGAQLTGSEGSGIGRRNQRSMEHILRRAGVLVHHRELGGTEARSLRIEAQSGRVLMKSGSSPEQVIGAPPHATERNPSLVRDLRSLVHLKTFREPRETT